MPSPIIQSTRIGVQSLPSLTSSTHNYCLLYYENPLLIYEVRTRVLPSPGGINEHARGVRYAVGEGKFVYYRPLPPSRGAPWIPHPHTQTLATYLVEPICSIRAVCARHLRSLGHQTPPHPNLPPSFNSRTRNTCSNPPAAPRWPPAPAAT